MQLLFTLKSILNYAFVAASISFGSVAIIALLPKNSETITTNAQAVQILQEIAFAAA